MATKPNVYPEFCTDIDDDGVGTVTDPNSGQQNAQPPSVVGYSVSEGFKLEQFAPRQILNHLFGLSNKWLKWLDQYVQDLEARITTNENDIEGIYTAGTVRLQLFAHEPNADTSEDIGTPIDASYTIYSGFINLEIPMSTTGNGAAIDENKYIGYYFVDGAGTRIGIPDDLKGAYYSSDVGFTVIGSCYVATDELSDIYNQMCSIELIKPDNTDSGVNEDMKEAFFFRYNGHTGEKSTGGNFVGFYVTWLQAVDTQIVRSVSTYR